MTQPTNREQFKQWRPAEDRGTPWPGERPTDGADWLSRRVRVWSGNPIGPKIVLAEGVVIGYSPAPTIMVRDAQGRDNHWQVTLPIETLEMQVSEAELAELRAAGDRWRATSESWGEHTQRELDQILREAGIEYPLGLRGVRDLVNQRDGHLEEVREARDLAARSHAAVLTKYAEAAELRDELDALRTKVADLLEKYQGSLPVELAQVLDR